MQIEKKHFNITNSKWSISLEAILSGHESWITSVHWHSTDTNGII